MRFASVRLGTYISAIDPRGQSQSLAIWLTSHPSERQSCSSSSSQIDCEREGAPGAAADCKAVHPVQGSARPDVHVLGRQQDDREQPQRQTCTHCKIRGHHELCSTDVFTAACAAARPYLRQARRPYCSVKSTAGVTKKE